MRLQFAIVLSLMTFVTCAFPSREDIKEASSIVDDLVAEDIKAANDGKVARGVVAAKLLTYVDEAETDAAKWILLKHAFIQYALAADYVNAAATMNRILDSFDDIPLSLAVSLIERYAGKATAENAPDLMVIRQRLKLKSCCEAVLANKKSSRLSRAEATCLIGDWKNGLELLAALDGEVASIAKGEMDGSVPIDKVANFWWEYKCQLDSCNMFKAHAVELYRTGVSTGSITGLRKSVAEKRIGEFATIPAFETKKEKAKSPRRVASNGLLHRWSFSHTMRDYAGGIDAKAEGGKVKFDGGQVRVEPGSGYVSLGADLFPVNGEPFTLEIWATCHRHVNWARVFSMATNWEGEDSYWFWMADGDTRRWWWKVSGCVRWSRYQGDGLAPGREHHFYVVCDRKKDDGKNYYRVGVFRGTNLYWARDIDVAGSVFKEELHLWLGHSPHKHDSNADASYNEVRIWNRALTSEELKLSAAAGPDKLPMLKLAPTSK